MEKNRFYLTANVLGDNVYFREILDGEVKNRKMKWGPTVYLKCNKEEADFVSLYKQPAKSKKFDTVSSAREFVKTHKDISNLEVFGQLDWTLQFLNEYPQTETQFGLVPITSIDIETRVPEDGFPKPIEAKAEITLITLVEKTTKKVVTFGTKPYTGKDTDYRYSKNETEMLLDFISYWQCNCPVVATGWNSNRFDFPYLVNRITKILGENVVNRLSPYGRVNIRPSRIDPETIDVTIYGVELIDYLELMKKFTYGERASWKLESVAQEELGTTKLDHSEYKTFNDFQDQNWEKFVRYNVIDAKLVLMLDDKMKLFGTMMTVAYLAKINYSDVYSPVKTWDAILHNALLADGIVVPQRKETHSSGRIMGGYVKTPVPGMYTLGASIDATSLYPSIMRLLNLSPETYRGMIPSDIESILNGKQFENLERDNISVAANGATFDKTEIGIIPKLIKKIMADRRTAKNQMLALESEYEVSKNELLLDKISALNNLQMALKILQNALFGSLSNEGFRFFNNDVAEAITSTGQLYLRSIENNLDNKVAEVFKIPDLKILIYIDTDSCYFTLQKVMEKYADNLPMDKKIKALEKLTKEKIVPLVDEICGALNKTLNIYEPSISFKLEAAYDKIVLVAKKKYFARVYSSEGVTYDKSKIKIMGLEMIRSSTPKLVREELVKINDLVLDSTEEKLQRFIGSVEEEFKTSPVENIARPIGVSEMTDIGKGTPIHVRAAHGYNDLIRKYKLETAYPLIRSGDKTQYVYLKMPNPVRQNVIGWPIDEGLPKEFGLEKYIDRDLQFEKTFLTSVKIILDAVKWSPIKIDSLDDFFG